MSHARVICRRPLLLAGVVLVSMLAMAGVAHASGFGEIRRFGAPGASLGELTAAKLEKGNETLEWEPWHVIGVDPEEGNAVFVLEEYKESKSIKHGKKEWSIRYLRLQKLSETGTLLGDRELTVETPSTGVGAPQQTEEIEGIAVDAKEGRLYFLVTEELEGGVPGEEEAAAAYLYAFNTAPGSGKKLEPAPGANSEGVLAGPKELGAESKEPGKALLSPSGIAVDPKTHEVLIAAHVDTATKEECEEEEGGEPGEEDCEPDSLENPDDHYVIQHVEKGGKLAEQTTDASNVLKMQEAESNFFPPASPVVVGPEASERLLSQHLSEVVRGEKKSLIAEFPDGPSGAVTQFAQPDSGGYESGFEEIVEHPESNIGGTLAVSPEGTTLYGVTRLGEHEAGAHGGQYGITERSAATLQPIGWSGGQVAQTANDDACAISPGAWEGEHIQIAAGKEGKIFVLVPEYLHKAELEGTEFARHEAIVEFGPGGAGCPVTSVEKSLVNGKETSAPVGTNTPVALSTSIKQGDALSVVWKIENEATKATVTETQGEDQYQTPQLTYTFTTPGSYKITEEITTDNLDTPKLSTSRTLVVEEKNEAPTVTTQPLSATVEAGKTATFTAAASGKPAPTPRWQVKTPGGGWSEDGEDAGAKGLTLSVLASEAKNGNQYRAVFTNSSGSKETEPATLTVTPEQKTPPPPPPPPTPTTTTPPPAPTTTTTAGQQVLPVTVEAPRATIAGAATLTVSKSGAVSVSVSCPAKATTCIGTVTLRTATAVSASSKSKKKAILTLASGSFSIVGGQTKTLTLHLSGTAKGLLAKLHDLRAKATVAAHDPAGEAQTTTRLLTLRPAPVKKHKG